MNGYYLKPRRSLRRLSCALSLAFGLAGTLLLPRPASAQEQELLWARIDFIRNRVQLVRQDQQGKRASISDVLRIGDSLRTARASRAELRFNDGSLARIGERATFRFTPNTRNFQLNNGTILLLIPPGLGRSTIQTPNAVTGIQGSALFVRYIPETDTTIVGALTNNPNGPMVLFNRDGTEQQALRANEIGVIQGDQITELYEFDGTLFWQSSGLAEGFNYLSDSSSGSADSLDGVRQEIREAISSQDRISGDSVITNPEAFAAPATDINDDIEVDIEVEDLEIKTPVLEFEDSPAQGYLESSADIVDERELEVGVNNNLAPAAEADEATASDNTAEPTPPDSTVEDEDDEQTVTETAAADASSETTNANSNDQTTTSTTNATAGDAAVGNETVGNETVGNETTGNETATSGNTSNTAVEATQPNSAAEATVPVTSETTTESLTSGGNASGSTVGENLSGGADPGTTNNTTTNIPAAAEVPDTSNPSITPSTNSVDDINSSGTAADITIDTVETTSGSTTNNPVPVQPPAASVVPAAADVTNTEIQTVDTSITDSIVETSVAEEITAPLDDIPLAEPALPDTVETLDEIQIIHDADMMNEEPGMTNTPSGAIITPTIPNTGTVNPNVTPTPTGNVTPATGNVPPATAVPATPTVPPAAVSPPPAAVPPSP